MNFEEHYNASKDKVELVDTFCVELIGIFGLLGLNKTSPVMKKYFYENRVFRLNCIRSTDPTLIVVTDKLQRLGYIRVWTVQKIYSFYECLKYRTIEEVSEDEIRQILFDVNENLILPSPQFRSLIYAFRDGSTSLEKSVRPLYSKALMLGKPAHFIELAKVLKKE